jgi:outer membrane protein OmpA-like peptidoglycan-associated protein
VKGAASLCAAAALMGMLAATPAVQAQAPKPPTPEVQAMIDALRPAAPRNLSVRPRMDAPPPLPAAASGPAAPAPGSAAAAGAAPVAPPALPAGPPPAAPAATPGAQPAAPPALPPAAPTPSLTLPLVFEPNGPRVLPQSGGMLGDLFAALLSPELRGQRFVIEAHVDARGSAASHARLTQQRADEVRQYLVALGVAPERLRAVGRGSSEPLQGRDPTAPENRRVRVVAQQ